MILKKCVEICFLVIAFLVLSLGALGYAQDSPSLPPGLERSHPDDDDIPSLPPGLSEEETPQLPEGLDTPKITEKDISTPQPQEPLVNIIGFGEIRGGVRLWDDRYEKRESLGEGRLQLEIDRSWTRMGFKITGDFIYDPVLDRHRISLNDGEGWFDLREAFVFFTPLEFSDVKIGRQIMTWGTGDLLFINDLFPKDWNSFFIGRDVEYLKSSSDALRVTLFNDYANIDLYYSPEFDADRYVDGKRVSYWNIMERRRAGRDRIIRPEQRSQWFTDDETGGRLFKNLRGYELAAYWHIGFWKSPAGTDMHTNRANFPALNVYGASIRGRVLGGIGNLEFGYYDSKEDRGGDDPFVRNSEVRLLIGFDEEVKKDFTVGLQYYLEHMQHYNSYRRTLPRSMRTQDLNRHVITVRLTQLLLKQDLTLSLFMYWSPSDSDCYFRPNIKYKISDNLIVEAGGNIFAGRHDYTFFGQFEKNSDIYFSIRKYFVFLN